MSEGEKEQSEDMSVDEAMSVQEAMSKAERKQRVAQLLRAGMVNDRLSIPDEDPNRHYIFVRENDQDIARMRSLGARIETEAAEHLAEGHADNLRRVGDVVLMSMSKEDHEIIREVKQERIERKKDLGEREYKEKAAQNPFPTIDPRDYD